MTQKANKKILTAAERERIAVGMRLGGASYQAIGDHLEITRMGAWKAVMRSLKKTREKTAEDAVQLREIERQRLEKMITAISPAALQGHLGAVKEVRMLSERLSKLQGLDAPVKKDITSGGEKIKGYVGVSPDGWDDSDTEDIIPV